MERQRTKEWFLKRLGYFTGSKMGDLFKSPKGKDKSLFGDTALSLIYHKAFERSLSAKTLNNETLWEMYQDFVSVSSKAMRFGEEIEPVAREQYEKATGLKMVETGFITHKKIAYFGSSSDGFHYNEDEQDKGCLEIKCPSGSVFMKYKNEVKESADLLKCESKYYIQCQCHILTLDADWCDFVVFNPFINDKLHIVRIYPDRSIQDEIKYRVDEANKLIDSLLNNGNISS